ncbi:MAG: acyl carrier protein [Planctomycetota bacterium]|nr:acyl carrier protein [Planctomycetota bacterium]
MAEENVKEKVVDIICKLLEVPREKVTMEARYAEDLGADSLDTAELVLEFEDVFKISVPEDAEGRIRTVGETVKFIEEELAKKKAMAS